MRWIWFRRPIEYERWDLGRYVELIAFRYHAWRSYRSISCRRRRKGSRHLKRVQLSWGDGHGMDRTSSMKRIAATVFNRSHEKIPISTLSDFLI
ncbi:hypothetical protein ABKN59_003554 [Abortiporus biennis]